MTTHFSNKLLTWYGKHKRDLPWRDTKNPYFIWLSEIILQQTRVNQGMPYYDKFVSTFPTIYDLAKADEEQVLKLWQGLGYYSRARNLHFTAQYIVNELNGSFPNNYQELLKLKGVGDYTASAIASFAYNEVTPTVDGNVYRVLSRYFGIKTSIDTPAAKKEFKELAFELIDPKNPADFNQAIMEFGATHCTPKKPDCTTCIYSDSCIAFSKGEVSIFPYKKGKTKVRKRFFNYIVVQTKDHKTITNKRTQKGIWQNLHEFPLIETDAKIEIKELLNNEVFKNLTTLKSFELLSLHPKSSIHKLSHQHLHIKFWQLNVSDWENAKSWKKTNLLPFPVVIHNFIKSQYGKFL